MDYMCLVIFFISRKIIRIMYTRPVGVKENSKSMMKNISDLYLIFKRANKAR